MWVFAPFLCCHHVKVEAISQKNQLVETIILKVSILILIIYVNVKAKMQLSLIFHPQVEDFNFFFQETKWLI